jgi:hypothetical protein
VPDGFDEQRLPKLREAMDAPRMRLGAVRSARDVQVVEADANGSCCDVALEALAPAKSFDAHPGWRGHVEGRVRAGAPRRGAA